MIMMLGNRRREGEGCGGETYVRVAYDFEYCPRDDKRVVMRENEILLLIKKTNGDWWQVIRRGDRRPFYAPAKYVEEMGPVVAESSMHGDLRFYKGLTTFGSDKFSRNKRSSYAAVEPHSRLTAGYRSNSLDSILVSDRTKAMFTLRDIKTDSQQGAGYLEKRPTLDALDKRKSWNVLDSGRGGGGVPPFRPPPNHLFSSPPPLHGRLGAYQNTQGLILYPSHRNANLITPMSKASKKPVPLPRSRVPSNEVAAPLQTSTVNNQRIYKRSKTDLTLEAVKAYKANFVGSNNHIKFSVPKLPASFLEKKGMPIVDKKKPAVLSTFRGKNDEETEDRSKSILSRVVSENDVRSSDASQGNEDSLRNVETSQKERENDNLFVKSEPLIITTEPLNDNSRINNRLGTSLDSSIPHDEDLTKSSSFDSFDDSSIDDAAMLSLNTIPDGKSKYYDETSSSAFSPDLKSPASTTSRSPPSPGPDMTPTRNVMVEWDEYCDESSGRKFYYNTLTKEKSWKPPRKSKGSSEGYSAPTSPVPESDNVKRKLDLSDAASGFIEEDTPLDQASNSVAASSPTESEIKNIVSDVQQADIDTFPIVSPPNDDNSIPDGYERHSDGENSYYYVNMFTGVRWFSANDSNGKIYYYEENGNESCWTLPNVSQSIQDPNNSSSSSSSIHPSPEVRRRMPSVVSDEYHLVEDAKPVKWKDEEETSKRFVSSPNFQIGSVNIVVLKQGLLNKTKLMENGKKQRKNWCSSHVVLTDTFLLFFKDAKVFASMQNSNSGGGKPEHVVDLKGTSIDWCKGDKSKRSNVFEVNSTLFGMNVLLQEDSLSVAAEWFREINNVIGRINGIKAEDLLSKAGSVKGDSISSTKVSRTKSIKMKFLGSSEELESPPIGASPPTFESVPPRTNIREKLRKFFLRRPTMEDLFKKGIIKNEPVFGSTLRELQVSDSIDVPNFVKRCIREIEKGEHLKTDGVYRQSGNLSTIQKIRLQVDQGNLGILETVDDVHVLTGALKLFFRELKEPLVPWDCVGALLQVPTQPNRKTRLKSLRDILAKMPQPNRLTLIYLLKHLSKVTDYKEINRMQIHNLAIVFGPTLMWPPPHLGTSSNLALDMMQQNIVVETLLTNVNHIA